MTHATASPLAPLLALGLAALTATAQPWQQLDLDAARDQSTAQGQPLLVLISAPGCLGCYQLDKLTWPNPELSSALADRFVAIRPDLEDLDPVMAELGVTGFPTLVRLENGTETARMHGYRTPEYILSWLDSPSSLVNEIQGTGAPIGDVYDRAIDLYMDGREPEKTATALAEVWVRASVEPDVTPFLHWLRRDKFPSMLRRVAEQPEGRAIIEQLLAGFDPAGPAPDDHPALVADWVTLSRVLGSTDPLDAWIDRALSNEEGRARLEGLLGVFDRLAETDRWEDAGSIATEPMWHVLVCRIHDEPTGDPVNDSLPEHAINIEKRQAPEKLERFVRALRAAGRDAQADELANVL